MRRAVGKAVVGNTIMKYFVTGDDLSGYKAEIQESVVQIVQEPLLPGGKENFQKACRFVQLLQEGSVTAETLPSIAEDYRSDLAAGFDRFTAC